MAYKKLNKFGRFVCSCRNGSHNYIRIKENNYLCVKCSLKKEVTKYAIFYYDEKGKQVRCKKIKDGGR